MRKIKDEEIRPYLLELLIKIDEVCRRSGIKYVLQAGTLLGAVRHKGFIPWDDDVDLAMPREDYDRFIELTSKEDCGFDFFCYENNPDYTYAFGKACLRGTHLTETGRENIDLGLYVDVFPLDPLPDNERKKKRFIRKYTVYSILCIFSKFKNHSRKKTDTFKMRFLKWGAQFAGRLMGYKFWLKKFIKAKTKYANNQSKQVGIVCDPRAIIPYERQWLDDLCELSFEGHMFFAISEYDELLTRTYGDYMQLPPVEKRVRRHNFVVYED